MPNAAIAIANESPVPVSVGKAGRGIAARLQSAPQGPAAGCRRISLRRSWPSLHGRNPLPAWPRDDPLLSHRLAAPRADDHIGRGRNHLVARDDAVLRQPGMAPVGEDRIAAGDLDQLLDPANAADQRVVPFLEVDARPPRQRAGRPRISSSPASSSPRQRLALRPPRRRCRRARGSSAGSRRRCAG